MRRIEKLALGAALGAVATGVATWLSLAPVPAALDPPPGTVQRARVVDRRGQVLSRTYENAFNVHDTVRLHEVPQLLHDAVLEAEDRHFFEHGGADWRARAAAVVQNVRALSVV